MQVGILGALEVRDGDQSLPVAGARLRGVDGPRASSVRIVAEDIQEAIAPTTSQAAGKSVWRLSAEQTLRAADPGLLA